MKEGIHPKYVEATVECACGNRFVTRSTKPLMKLEICSNCHPFYTGRQKLMDTAGRVERFTRRFSKTGGKTLERKPATKKAAPKPSAKTAKILRNVPSIGALPAKGKAPKGSKAPKPETAKK